VCIAQVYNIDVLSLFAFLADGAFPNSFRAHWAPMEFAQCPAILSA